jgi:hypothetical protein
MIHMVITARSSDTCHSPLVSPALFSNRKSSELMRYRATYESEDGELSDVFDGSHYRHLQSRKVQLWMESAMTTVSSAMNTMLRWDS